MFVHMTTQLGL